MTMRNNFRLAVCGAGAVGKSCCTITFINPHQKISGVYDPTIQDSYMKEVEFEGQKVFLEVIDTAGQDEYDALRDQYMRESDGFLVIYDITDRQSFIQVDDFVQHINMVKEDQDTIPMVLVGNKSDLKANQKISEEEAKKYAKVSMGNAPFFYASALQRYNIDECFNALIAKIVTQEKLAFEERKKKQTQNNSKDKTSCCTVM